MLFAVGLLQNQRRSGLRFKVVDIACVQIRFQSQNGATPSSLLVRCGTKSIKLFLNRGAIRILVAVLVLRELLDKIHVSRRRQRIGESSLVRLHRAVNDAFGIYPEKKLATLRRCRALHRSRPNCGSNSAARANAAAADFWSPFWASALPS
jgi:hypothetical protein